MGCVGSKVRNGVAVSHCRHRKHFVKRAIKSRKHFVIDHANYLVALKTMGAAFREFALVEFREQQNRDLPSSLSPHILTAETVKSSSLSVTKMPALANLMPYQNTPFPSKTVIVAPYTSKIAYCHRDRRKTATPWRLMDSEKSEEESVRPMSLIGVKEESICTMRPLAPMAYVNTPSVSERVVVSPMRVMAYQNGPFVPDTVIISPTQSPDDQRRFSSYRGYMYNASPPQELYNGPPASSSQEPGAPSSIFTAGWEWLDLFSAPPMPMHFKGSPSVRDEVPKQVPEEEMPALEVAETPPHETETKQQNNAEIEHVKVNDEMEEDVKVVKANTVRVEKNVEKDTGISKGKEHEELVKEIPQEDVEAGESGDTSLKPSNTEQEETTLRGGLHDPVKENFEKNRNLLEVLTEIDILFLKASESGKNAFKVLEASKLPYHSNYTDLRGFSDHSARFSSFVSRSYLSHRTPFSSTSTSTSVSTPTSSSTPTSTAPSEDSAAEDPSLLEGHASTLDKIYAWENKLCKEVKERELLSIQLERKRRKIQRLDARREGDDKIDRVRASLKVLETERAVADQAMDVTVSTIRNLTDDQLYPQLLQLLEELTTMWREMCACHERQRDIVFRMRIFEDQAMESTSNTHWKAMQQLEAALNNLLKSFSVVMTSQKEYISNLNGWLSSSLYGLERGSNPTPASMTSKAAPHIYYLCRRWKRALDKLPYNAVMVAIKKFVKIAREIMNLQSNELRIKKHLDNSTKDLAKKVQALHNAELKYSSLVKVREMNSATDDQGLVKSRIKERTDDVERQRKKVEGEREVYMKAMQATRLSTLNNFKVGLPEFFQTFYEFASQCAQAYDTLYSREKGGKFESD